MYIWLRGAANADNLTAIKNHQSRQYGLLHFPAQIEMMTDDQSAIVRIKFILIQRKKAIKSILLLIIN